MQSAARAPAPPVTVHGGLTQPGAEPAPAWVAGRLNAATVDGYRRRRGQRGALQRPRVPGWLAAELGAQRWLIVLATRMLEWVGVSGTAGAELWPVDTWAQERAACTGDWAGSDPVVVAREVERVLGAMRKRPRWYMSYVERPLGRKQPAVALLPAGEGGGPSDPEALIDAEMSRLAADAVRAIQQRRGRGEQTERIVADVIRTVFGGPFTPTIDRAPHGVADPVGGVSGAITDPARLARIVSTVREIIGE